MDTKIRRTGIMGCCIRFPPVRILCFPFEANTYHQVQRNPVNNDLYKPNLKDGDNVLHTCTVGLVDGDLLAAKGAIETGRNAIKADDLFSNFH